MQELNAVNYQQKEDHLQTQAATQAAFDTEKSNHIAEFNNLRNEFKKRDSQYV